jgi:AraC family transcriptional regulator
MPPPELQKAPGEKHSQNVAMENVIEREVVLPRVAVHLATIHWDTAQEREPMETRYCVCQRLSENHAPLRIGNVNAREAFPRVRSVGFLPPGCAVRLYPIDGPFRVLNCAFEKSYFEEIAEIGQDQWEEHTNDLVAIRDRRLELMMQEIYGELIQPDFGHDILIEAASTMILVELARYGRRLGQGKLQGQTGQGLAPWQLRRIHDRIDASLELGYPSIEELSLMCGISQSHLMRTFKASTGWPIHKFIAEDRLKAAKHLLVSEHLDTKEISGKLGFRSPAYFATAFRRMTGKTPTEYRREARAMEFGRS